MHSNKIVSVALIQSVLRCTVVAQNDGSKVFPYLCKYRKAHWQVSKDERLITLRYKTGAHLAPTSDDYTDYMHPTNVDQRRLSLRQIAIWIWCLTIAMMICCSYGLHSNIICRSVCTFHLSVKNHALPTTVKNAHQYAPRDIIRTTWFRCQQLGCEQPRLAETRPNHA